MRLMALYYALRCSPGPWEALHGLILPLAPVVLMALFFLRWTSATPVAQAPKPQARAA